MMAVIPAKMIINLVLVLVHLLMACVDASWHWQWADRCKPVHGDQVNRWGYTTGSCYFMPHNYWHYTDLQTRCALLWPGAHGAILPDAHVAQQLVASTQPDGNTASRHLLYMAQASGGYWMYMSGFRADTSGGVDDGWVWLLPDGTHIPISTAEASAAGRHEPWDSSRGGDYMITYSNKLLLGDDVHNQIERGLLCQKRVAELKFATKAGYTGQGAQLGAAAVLPNNNVCMQRCMANAACLSYSWLSANSTCQLHYVTSNDYKLSLAITQLPADRFAEVID